MTNHRVPIQQYVQAGITWYTEGKPVFKIVKELVDGLSPAQQAAAGALVVPVALIVAYGLLRLSTSLFTELRNSSS